ncbi:isoprenoid synthase domain-containing protein [Melanogaster broomeanus]|nr:isoprenoid synthase domain-containing protein [Melanogaster broomeanus]
MSVQLPDLLSICSTFELRTNRHCRAVSQASERWLVASGVALRSLEWRAAKPGLLAAACYPNTDAPQLRLITDLLSLLLYSNEQSSADAGTIRSRCEWLMLTMLSDRLSRVAFKNPGWYMRSTTQPNAVFPDLESYIELRRDASGLRMALAMIEFAGDLSKAVDHASDVAAWSEDIISSNIVTILMKERNASLESALTSAGTLVKQSVDAFVMTEETLLSSLDLCAGREARRYIQGLRDWVAGFVNWLYETELFLGEKGNEVRMFGWVFVPVPVSL